MTPAATTPLDEVLYAFAVASPTPDATRLDEFTKRYPEYADALTSFAIELMIDHASPGKRDEAAAEAGEAVSPAVARAISHFHNTAYDLETKSAILPQATSLNPFAALDMSGFRSVAASLRANNTFVTKLRDRMIEPETIISRPGFCSHLAEALAVPDECVIAHFQAEQSVGSGQFYKAEGKPSAARRQTFEEAVRKSGLTEEQQAFLLSL
jgi:hypothetical protein